jgi:hypothetical protein
MYIVSELQVGIGGSLHSPPSAPTLYSPSHYCYTPAYIPQQCVLLIMPIDQGLVDTLRKEDHTNS